MIYDLIIIGLGPAGISAAIYAKRAGLNVLAFESSLPGGLLNNTIEIENYPGLKTTKGVDLAKNMFEHFLSLDIPYKNKKVIEIKEENDLKCVLVKDEEFLTKKIIIATGRKPRKLGLDNEEKLTGRGVSYCAVCDAPLYKKRDVAVIGAGNSALEEAIYLSNIVNKVYLINRRDELRGDSILQDRIRKQSNIEIVYESNVTSFNEVDGKLKNITINNEKELDVACVFIYVGYVPALDFIGDLLDTNPSGYIIVDKNFESSCKGIYAAGDIIEKKYYQIITAASEGATAALNVVGALKTRK